VRPVGGRDGVDDLVVPAVGGLVAGWDGTLDPLEGIA
jgi:hypothetical protein